MDMTKMRLNTSAETDGVWIDWDEDTSLLIARYRNPKHQQYVERKMEPYRRAQRMGTLDQSIIDRIEKEAMAKYVLLGWKGLKEGGAEVVYSADKALEYFSDPQYKIFFETVQEYSLDMSLFRQEALDEKVENIKKSSTGN